MKFVLFIYVLLFSAPSLAVSVYVDSKVPLKTSQVNRMAKQARSFLISQGQRPQSKIKWVKDASKADVALWTNGSEASSSKLGFSFTGEFHRNALPLHVSLANQTAQLGSVFKKDGIQDLIVVVASEADQKELSMSFKKLDVGAKFVVVPRYQKMASNLIPVLSEERQEHGTNQTALLWMVPDYASDVALISNNIKIYQKFKWYIYASVPPKSLVRDPLVSEVYKKVGLTWLSPKLVDSAKIKRWLEAKGFAVKKKHDLLKLRLLEILAWIQSNSDKFYEETSLKEIQKQSLKSLTGGLEWSRKGLRKGSDVLVFQFKKVGKRGFWKPRSN